LIHLYWLKRKVHDDITSQGYVGISKDPKSRMWHHQRRESENPHLFHAFEKYDDIEQVIVESFESYEEAFAREEELRPMKFIGWNGNKGGFAPPKVEKGSETAKKISDTLKKSGRCPYDPEKTHSPEAKAKRYAKSSVAISKLKWYTDGSKSIRVLEGTQPEGFRRGRKGWAK